MATTRSATRTFQDAHAGEHEPLSTPTARLHVLGDRQTVSQGQRPQQVALELERNPFTAPIGRIVHRRGVTFQSSPLSWSVTR
jgi:hypothetical protein